MKNLVFLVVATVVAAFIPMNSSSQNPVPNQPQSTPLPHKALDRKAKAADVTNPETISELTHNVVNYPHYFSMPPEMTQKFENALNDAETKYRLHQDRGVSETEIVDLSNRLIKRFKLPDYIAVTHAQVRHLRMNLTLQSPSFMGPGLSHGPLSKGDSIDDHMSPLQAFHLATTLIDQKFLNPAYQDPKTDLAKADQDIRHQARILRLTQNSQNKHVVIKTTNYHRLELHRLVLSNASAMNSSDADEIMKDALSVLSHKQ